MHLMTSFIDWIEWISNCRWLSDNSDDLDEYNILIICIDEIDHVMMWLVEAGRHLRTNNVLFRQPAIASTWVRLCMCMWIRTDCSSFVDIEQRRWVNGRTTHCLEARSTTASTSRSDDRASEASNTSTSGVIAATPQQIAVGRERYLRAVPSARIARLVRHFQGLAIPSTNEDSVQTPSPELSTEFYTPESGKSGESGGEDSGRSSGSASIGIASIFEEKGKSISTAYTPFWSSLTMRIC